MYYPIQIPYILHKGFSDNVLYAERTIESLSAFIICVWEIRAKSSEQVMIENIIVADGCIDLVVDFSKKMIGFTGMSQTEFQFKINTPCEFLGARLVPGAFYQLTGRSAKEAMDTFLPLSVVDRNFNHDLFFSSTFEQAKEYFLEYLHLFSEGKKSDVWMGLFHELTENPLITATKLYTQLHYSPRQCQRYFEKHFGLSPKLVLSIIRFQRSLQILIADEANANDILTMLQYYDQPHWIRDFKRNIGLTPQELLNRYKD